VDAAAAVSPKTSVGVATGSVGTPRGLARDLLRMAYVATEGTPRNVPIAFTGKGSQIVVCTPKNAPKRLSLRRSPEVTLTIDTEVHPPKILLIRGRAELDVVDGIPQEYLQ
jgi:hypothetical protein